jgi:Uma2 family endonuclease
MLSEDDFYPDCDGRPMAESDLHRDVMIDLIETLNRHFSTDPTVYVSGDLLLYYEKGRRRRRVAPDVFVVRGVVKKLRSHYLMWNEGKPPDCVIEVTSVLTRRRDRDKFRLYRDVLGVAELFLFDPLNTRPSPSLRGYRLKSGCYEPIEPLDDRLPSEVLQLHLRQHGEWLRFFTPRGGRPVRSYHELRGRPPESGRDLDRLRREIEEFQRHFDSS